MKPMIEQRWIIQDESGKFIDIDSASGGYPYLTDFWGAHKFVSFEKANSYAQMGWGSAKTTMWSIYVVEYVSLDFVPAIDVYEIELAALKKKHGKS